MPTGTTVEAAAKAAGDAKDVAQTHLQHLRTSIEKAEPQFAMALPEHVSSGRFIRAALTALNVVPRLAECEPRSVIAGLMQAAQLGLEVADVRGQCYLIPRRDSRAGVMKATFQLGYRGMVDLAARSGITVTAEDVHEGDTLDYGLGSRRYLVHRPTLRGNRGDAYAYYAVATFADAREPEFKIMGRQQIEEHRDRFASTRDGKGTVTGPWVEHFDAMARKTVIRALLNYLPVSVELRDAIRADAVEATTNDRPPPPELPANVDGLTGEIDALTVIEVDENPS
jgi:recombination protein RecT